MFKEYIEKYYPTSSRSKKAVRNIIISFGSQIVSIAVSFILVPLTIDYVNPTKYGVWLTLSSIIAWIGYFNFGLSNGFRNRFAEAKAKSDFLLASQYVSTTYFAIGVIVTFLYLSVTIANLFLDWSDVLNVDAVYKDELRIVFGIVSGFFCLNMFVNVFISLLMADQKPGIVSVINALGQILSLVSILILTKTTEGSLLKLALFYAGIPTVVLLVSSFLAFRFTALRLFTPSVRNIKICLIKNILSLGMQFFVISICMMLIFQVINIIITRELGADSVTQYNISYKYFNLIYIAMMVIVTPFWSAFTDAYYKNDLKWMGNAKKKLEQTWLIFVGISVLMVIFSPLFYKIWIGDRVDVSFSLSVCMAIYMLSQTLGAIYMHLINGVGTVRIQMITYLVFTAISWPLMTFSCRIWGLMGVLVVPTTVYVVQALLAKIQIQKILNHTAKGIWEK